MAREQEPNSREQLAQEFLEVHEKLKSLVYDLGGPAGYLEQLEDPVGKRNYTDSEIDSGKPLSEIIENDIYKTMEAVEAVSKKWRELREKLREIN
ncbi:MAG: hypothetical protein AAB897_00780 [Patescibacteria group bacterium]